MTTLGEVADFEMGQAPPGSDCNTDGIGTLFVKAGEFGKQTPIRREWTTKPLKFGRASDVFICVVGATAGKLNLGIECAIGRSVAAIRPSSTLDTRFLYYQLQPWVLKLRAASAGSAQGVITKRQLAEIPVDVPPLDKQRRIVAELEKQFSRLDEAVANLKRAKANVARFAKAILSAAVTGRLVETESAISEASGAAFVSGAELLQSALVARKQLWSGRGQYCDPSPPDARGLGALPSGWTWASADQLSDFITKGTTPSSSKLSEGGGDVQFLKVYNLTFDGSLNRAYKPAFVSRATHEKDLARSKVRPGDVLINIVGPPLGQVSQVPAELPEANINQAIARIRPVPPLSTRYIALALMAREVMDWAVRRAKTTAGQSNLTLELCRAIPIPLPPLAEQHRIVAEVDRRLSIVREVEAEVDANLARAQALRTSVLARAFRT